MENKEQFGLLAKDIRVKIVREPGSAGRAFKIPGQIGFKNKKTGGWDNYWLDVWCWPDMAGPLNLGKGDVIQVSGQFKMVEDSYQGNVKTAYSIWADSIAVSQQTGRPSPSLSSPGAERYEAQAQTLEDVPF